MKNLPYLLWAYVLIGLLISVYGMSLVRRFRQVAQELETLAAALRARRGEAVPPRAAPPPSQPPA
jgi:hypothetical protein